MLDERRAVGSLEIPVLKTNPTEDAAIILEQLKTLFMVVEFGIGVGCVAGTTVSGPGSGAGELCVHSYSCS
jgi:hypothetical protein